MANNSVGFLKDRIYLVHDWLIRAGESISDDQFAYFFSNDAPPIGWHLWHITRFADRLQSKLADVIDAPSKDEIWYKESISQKWSLVPSKLGVFESGMGQKHHDALETVIRTGQAAIIKYANDVFDACKTRIGKLSEDDFDKAYLGILDYGYDLTTGKVWASDPKESIVAQDMVFHASHGSRHMGMMEALRGLLGSAGTLSV